MSITTAPLLDERPAQDRPAPGEQVPPPVDQAPSWLLAGAEDEASHEPHIMRGID